MTYLTLAPIAVGCWVASGGEPMFHALGFSLAIAGTAGAALGKGGGALARSLHSPRCVGCLLAVKTKLPPPPPSPPPLLPPPPLPPFSTQTLAHFPPPRNQTNQTKTHAPNPTQHPPNQAARSSRWCRRCCWPTPPTGWTP